MGCEGLIKSIFHKFLLLSTLLRWTGPIQREVSFGSRKASIRFLNVHHIKTELRPDMQNNPLLALLFA